MITKPNVTLKCLLEFTTSQMSRNPNLGHIHYPCYRETDEGHFFTAELRRGRAELAQRPDGFESIFPLSRIPIHREAFSAVQIRMCRTISGTWFIGINGGKFWHPNVLENVTLFMLLTAVSGNSGSQGFRMPEIQNAMFCMQHTFSLCLQFIPQIACRRTALQLSQ